MRYTLIWEEPDHLRLYEQLVWEALLHDGVGSLGGSLIVDGVMCGMVKDGRIVLLFDEDRVAELVAQNLGAIYQGNDTRTWLVVEPEVDEATFRELFSEATADRNVPRAAIAEFARKIAAEIRALPELSTQDWDSYSMAAEVADGLVQVVALRSGESGPPVPTAVPENDELFWRLHDTTVAADGKPWAMVLVKLGREVTNVRVSFLSGADAAAWRAAPENLAMAVPRESLPLPVHFNEDVNLVVGDRTTTTPPAAAWSEVSRHRYAVWAGRAVDGATGLLVRAHGSDPETRAIHYQAVGVVRLSEVARRTDGGYRARVQSVPLPPAEDLDEVISREELAKLLRRAADRDPTVVTGWRRPSAMRAPVELAEPAFSAVAEDLLRRLAMPLSTRIELMIRPERERLQILIDQLREIADGTPPQPETAQRLDRPLIDLPPHGIPVLANDIWLTPGNVSTITASAFISEKALAEGWLAFTADLTVGRAAMATRPLRRSDTVNASGFYHLTTDQIRPAIVRAVLPGEAGRFLVELAPAPSAEEAAGRGLPEPDEERERLAAYVELHRRAHARDHRVTGTATGSAYRLWQASRFTSLRALMSWQIGQLGFGAQTVLELQAIAWPDRLRVLTLVLQRVATGRRLEEATAEAADIAAAALHRSSR